MRIQLTAGLKSPADAEVFNNLVLYCMQRAGKLDSTQEGRQVHITITGPDELFGEMKDYLVERSLGVI